MHKCEDCGTPLEKTKVHPISKRKPYKLLKWRRAYRCPKCRAMYFVTKERKDN